MISWSWHRRGQDVNETLIDHPCYIRNTSPNTGGTLRVVYLGCCSISIIRLILSNYALGIEVDQIMKLYKNATKDKFNFLKIDIENRDDNKKFSHNFTGFFKIDDEDSDSD